MNIKRTIKARPVIKKPYSDFALLVCDAIENHIGLIETDLSVDSVVMAEHKGGDFPVIQVEYEGKFYVVEIYRADGWWQKKLKKKRK